MILDRQAFNYQGKVLIEKVFMQIPFHNEVFFQNEGCLLYFKDVTTNLFSSEDNIQLERNEAVLLRCGTYFFDLLKQTNTDKVEVIAIHLYPEMLKDIYISELPALIEKRSYSKKSQVITPNHAISKYIESLDFYFENPSLVNNDLLQLKIKELILLLVQTKSIESILELVTDLYSSKSVSLKRVIELHMYSNFKIEQLAKLCNMSLSSFKREFKKEFNDSPQSYILTMKLEKAKELLSLTHLPINEIAYETGFNDPLYFSRLFKKRIGQSPSDYRKGD